MAKRANTIAVSERIDRPPEDIWAVLTDWPNATRWMAGIDEMSIEGETAVGARVHFKARGRERSSIIVDCDPPNRITLRSVQGSVTADYTYTIQQLGEIRCLVSLEAHCGFGLGLATLVSPLIRRAIRRADGGQITALKRVAEES